ncbi:hypothetical protein MMC07_004803 [Pseudocyphellaria aurata]|nr:hypothetical protein [Pseudocyphellaria aurata]
MFFAPDKSGRMQSAGNSCLIRKDRILKATANPWFYEGHYLDRVDASPHTEPYLESMSPAGYLANDNVYSDDKTDTNLANLIVPVKSSPGTLLSPGFTPHWSGGVAPTIDADLNTAGSVANLNPAGSVADANIYSDNKADTNLSPNFAPPWQGGMARIDANFNTAGSDGADCTVYGCGGVASFMQLIPSISKRGMPVEFRA